MKKVLLMVLAAGMVSFYACSGKKAEAVDSVKIADSLAKVKATEDSIKLADSLAVATAKADSIRIADSIAKATPAAPAKKAKK